MHPHSYTVDSQSKAQDLASTILASVSSSQIISACASIETFLHSHSTNQSRHFFSLTFPTLICKLFGFEDSVSSSSRLQSSNGWIDNVFESNDLDFADRVFALLSPNGVLFHSISVVDRLSLVKYVFPIERLPEWVRFMFSNEKDCRVLSDLCPLFKGKVKEDSIKGSLYQIQLNVFEYYMFWFAYYPVCRGYGEDSDTVSVKRVKRFMLENWASSIRGFSGNKRGSDKKLECNLYLRLLYAYLRAFVPSVHDLSGHQPYRSSLLHYSEGYDVSFVVQVEFFVNTLIHFWLVDNDFSPLPMNVCKSFGIVFPFRSVLGETPPSSGLGEVVKLFVKFLNLSSVVQIKGSKNVEYSESPRSRMSSSFDNVKLREVMSFTPAVNFPGCWYLWIQRPLYRYILRSFLFCPVGSSIKNVSQVFSVWISYMEPWAIGCDDFSELDTITNGPAKNVGKDNSQSEASGYSPSWQNYVLSNYLYYSSLVMHFIGFAHKFLHTDVEIIVQMVVKVFAILTSSQELTNLGKNMDTVFHSKQAGSGKSILNSLSRYAPSIREQLQDWEDGLCESDADGSFLHENWNKDLRLFGDGEDSGQQLLQLFVLRAEAELQATSSGDNLTQNLQYLDSLKAQVSCLFGCHTAKTLSFSPEKRWSQQSRAEIFNPKNVGNHALADIKYKGDWMKRPISDDEVAWLAKLLVCFSEWLNESLGLNQSESNQVGPTWSCVEISSDVRSVRGPKETMKALLCAFGSWLLVSGSAVVGLMRKHGLRVNLRVFASKKVVMVLLLSASFSILKRTFGQFHRVQK